MEDTVAVNKRKQKEANKILINLSNIWFNKYEQQIMN